MEIIKVAEIWAHNKPNTKRVTIGVLKENGQYFYLTVKGHKGKQYKNLHQAKLDIQDIWGGWIDFKFLEVAE